MVPFECLRCSREFLSEYQLQRHYSWNPEHREPIVLDARELKHERETSLDAEWVEFDDRIETFLRVVGDVEVPELTFQYRPDEASVVVSGKRGWEQTIDVSEPRDRSSAAIQLSLDGKYLKMAFLKPD